MGGERKGGRGVMATVQIKAEELLLTEKTNLALTTKTWLPLPLACEDLKGAGGKGRRRRAPRRGVGANSSTGECNFEWGKNLRAKNFE